MAKFLYSAAMSLDGFIAGPGGDVSWMADYLGPNPVVDELIPQTGAILAGNRTFAATIPTKVSRARAKSLAAAGTGRSSCWRTTRLPTRFRE